MINFKNWLEYNQISQELGHILKEYNALIPRLEIRFNNLNDIENELKRAYAKEVRIQGDYGRTIGQPNVVIFNKIRHTFTNYDEVRAKLNKNVELGNIPVCEEAEMLESIYSQMKKIVVMIVNSIKYPFIVYENIIIKRKEDILKASDLYFNRERAILINTREKYCQ